MTEGRTRDELVLFLNFVDGKGTSTTRPMNESADVIAALQAEIQRLSADAPGRAAQKEKRASLREANLKLVERRRGRRCRMCKHGRARSSR